MWPSTIITIINSLWNNKICSIMIFYDIMIMTVMIIIIIQCYMSQMTLHGLDKDRCSLVMGIVLIVNISS